MLNQEFKILTIHSSAKPSHYDEASRDYDTYNEENSRTINQSIEMILKKYKIKSVLDLTCGTGSQVFWLKKRGYEVTGADINLKMLKVAKNKAKKQNLNIEFLHGDMRSLKVGKFDAAITIFNSVGHLTKRDFGKTMRNIHRNLRVGGLYIFDICNLDYFTQKDHITRLTIDWQKNIGKTKIRSVQYSTIDPDGVLASYTTSFEQKGSKKPKVSRDSQTLQVYSAKQLKEILHKNGFKVLRHSGVDGSKFIETQSERILTVAIKR